MSMMLHPAKPTARGMRYVDVKIAVPDDGTYPTGNMMGYFHPLPASSPTSANGTPSSASPFTFVPLATHNEATPPASPYGFNKATASPALTAATVDTCESPAMMLDARMTPPAMIASSSSRYTPSPIPMCRPIAKRFTPSSSQRKAKDSSSSTPNKKKLFTRDDDSVRKTRLKTEMCKNYKRGEPCPFGANCTYAHGADELQMQNLLDLKKAGLIVDVGKHRQLPCFTYVATGSCPFGSRCTNIHDTRVKGPLKSWLTHTETQGNNMDTDINVESLYQKRVNAVLYGNPFGAQFLLGKDDPDKIYKLVTNQSDKVAANQPRTFVLSPIHKVSIALQLIGGADWHYKFRPTHIIYGQLCMVLQRRAFRLTKEGDAVEIPISSYNARSTGTSAQVMVREIAFGPDSDVSVPGVALYFNVPEHEVSVWAQQQSKRFRWKRGLNKENNKSGSRSKGPSPFDDLERFFMVRPHDKEAFQLTTRILQHRKQELKAKILSGMQDRLQKLAALDLEKGEITERTEHLIKHWTKWACPNLRDPDEDINEKTPVLDVEQEYVVRNGQQGLFGSDIEKVWVSFLENMEAGDKEKEGKEHQLEPFWKLSRGQPISKKRNLPHINGFKQKRDPAVFHLSPSKESDRCWKDLLMKKPKESAGRKSPPQPGEWELVFEHFQKSRAKKVLNILQSQ